MNKQRVVLITGATSGIGHAIARGFFKLDDGKKNEERFLRTSGEE